MNTRHLLLAALMLAPAAFSAEPALKPLMLVPDQVVYHEDFNATHELDRETWRAAQQTQWRIEEGVLRGRPSSAEYQSTHKNHRGLEPRGALVKCPASYVAQFSVRFIGGEPPQPLPQAKSVPFIDIGHHIGRVEFGVEGVRLLADGDTLQLASAPGFRLEPGRWYEMVVEARDDEVTLQIAGGPTLHGRHPTLKGEMLPPGQNHTLAFIGSLGGVAEVDDLTLWSVKEGTQPAWPQTLAKLPAAEPTPIRPKRPGQLAKEKKDAEAKAAAQAK